MASLELHALLASPSSLDSPNPRSSVRFRMQRHIHLPVSSSTPFPLRSLHQCMEISTFCCFNKSALLHFDSSDNENEVNAQFDDDVSLPSESRLIKNAAWIGVATITSKILGLLREITLAAVFGVGPVATAFKYALVLPGFSASLLGGVNGPIHITMATTLSKLSKDRQRKLFQHTKAAMFLVGGAVGTLVFVFAELIIDVCAPGLWILEEGRRTREMAILQLKLMIPCIVFAGPVGVGFGYMSAEGNNILPSISPALSSMFVIACCAVYVSMIRLSAFQPGDGLSGGILISCGASIGSFLQWIIQVTMQERTAHNSRPVSWINILKNKDVHEFFLLMLSATVTSGLGQIASLTDLYFASHIPGAAAGLSYAFLLVMAPLGLLSSIIIMPLLPTISRLIKTLSWPSLLENLKRAVLLCMVVVLPIVSTMCVLAEPTIRFLFQRYAFDSAASTLVSSLFLTYSLGLPFHLIRELLVAVFYALGDGQLPFLVSVAAIAMNAILDWLFVSRLYLGAQGLALSTSFVTALSVLILLHRLLKKLAGVLDHTTLVCPLLLLFSCCIISAFSTSIAYKMVWGLLSNMSILRFCRIQELLSIFLAGSIGMIGFFFPLVLFHMSGFKVVRDISWILMNR